MTRARRLVQGLLQTAFAAAVLSAWPSLCQACSVCNDPKNQDSQEAFLDMTIFLSLLPLTLIGGICLWLWRRVKALEAEQAALEAGAGAGASASSLASKPQG